MSNKNKIDAYISWINSQLQKNPSSKLITNMDADLSDGTAFAELIEVLSGEKITNMVPNPSSDADKLLNIENVLKHMISQNIRFPSVQSADLLNGRVKAIMKIVLALAVHFKPSSIRRGPPLQYTHGNVASNSHSSMDFSSDSVFTTTKPSAMIDYPRIPASSSAFHLQQMVLADDDNELFDLQKDTDYLRKQLLRLQSILLDGATVPEPMGNDVEESPEVILLRGKLQQSNELCTELRKELSESSKQCIRLQDENATLTRRLADVETSFYQLKSHQVELNSSAESLNSSFPPENMSFEMLYRHFVAQKDYIQNMERELNDFRQISNSQMDALKQDIKNFSSQVQQGNNGGLSNGFHTDEQSDSHDTILSIQRALQRLCRSLPTNDPTRSALTDLTHKLSDTLTTTPSSKRAPVNALPDDVISQLNTVGGTHTKVLYYLNRSLDPLLCIVPKKLGDIKLKDIKAMINYHDAYRYHFKAIDPEFGTVKEEVCNDDDVVPGWDGKVVVWVDETPESVA